MLSAQEIKAVTQLQMGGTQVFYLSSLTQTLREVCGFDMQWIERDGDIPEPALMLKGAVPAALVNVEASEIVTVAPALRSQPVQTFVVHAEHFEIPGMVLKAFADLGDAEAEAMSTLDIMLKDASSDAGLPRSCTKANWRELAKALSDYYRDVGCYVELHQLPLR